MSSFAGRGTSATRTWNAWTRSSVAPSSDAIRAPIPRRTSRGPSRTPTASSPARVAPSRNGTNASARTTRGWAWRSGSSTTSSAPPRPLRPRREMRGRRKNAKTRIARGVSRGGGGANASNCRGCAGTRGSTRWPSGSASRSSWARSRRRISKTQKMKTPTDSAGTRSTEKTTTTTTSATRPRTPETTPRTRTWTTTSTATRSTATTRTTRAGRFEGRRSRLSPRSPGRRPPLWTKTLRESRPRCSGVCGASARRASSWTCSRRSRTSFGPVPGTGDRWRRPRGRALRESLARRRRGSRTEPQTPKSRRRRSD
mmetsp:Transcript_10036/g.41345  ORF Transcript_10036/g.41345 Transcript_10036/m.41345 type:complete len:313 (-) Transcript_10036:3537-4475(-)